MMSHQLPGIDLTREQTDILDTCQPPPTNGSKGQLVRVTAAAGTGKTTTLLSLALRAVEKGHTHITYLTFTKAAALDGTKRLSKTLATGSLAGRVIVDARTLHSCASQALNQHRRNKDPNVDLGQRIWSDKKVKKWISETLQAEIDSFLEPCFSELQRRNSNKMKNNQAVFETARQRVEFYLFKTLNNFCTKSMSRQDFGKRTTFGRVYYPAMKFHRSEKGDKLGFSAKVYGNRIDWYADMACILWDKAVEQDIRTFNFIMKRTQLLCLEVPGTILLIDESQDMDGCQVNWVADQVKYSKHAYVVGDAAQSIYGFRGAKPEFLMDLANDQEKMLTESWRFGPAIAKIANLVLFAKEESDQTSQIYDKRRRCMKWKNWSPYRVKTGKDMSAVVTDESLLSNWETYRERSEQITFIARQNKTLFVHALQLMGFTPKSDEDEKPSAQSDNRNDDEDDDFDILDDNYDTPPAQENETHRPAAGAQPDQPISFPRMHINGYGENSGRKAWLSMFKLVGAIYDLFKLQQGNNESSTTMRLPPLLFPEFAGRDIDWKSFCEDVQEREMNKYSVPIAVVKAYQDHTMSAVQRFKRDVIERNYSVEDADIILTTCHAAKGMEWQHVQVADDFVKLADYVIHNDEKPTPTFQPASKKMKTTQKWKFGFASWGDDVNLAYVACTRAKQTLSLPPCVLNSIRDFDTIFAWNNDDNPPDVDLPHVHGLAHRDRTATPENLKEIGSSLVHKYRVEVQVPNGLPLTEYLLT
ncbi:expressed unknown protein [Seminavis robusta]|uniref:UvrD-like helicase ATP-binding domain-containing protein n=1 Tax=Seminavis robusta TaxID=568900 RepID=A0A9N8DD16_9STRA|nr:expressed unknown protein [Seminavis robusta]|eukprot:Sro39_g024110.2  (756) ;mRNA; r:62637-64904